MYGRGEKRGGKWDSQGGGKQEKREKLCNIEQYFANQKKKNAKRQEPTNTGQNPD